MLLFPGNHSEFVYRVARLRGYGKVEPKQEEGAERLDFIWKPTQFSAKVFSLPNT